MAWTPEDAVKRELKAEETIRWTGTPSLGARASHHALGIVFGIMFVIIPSKNLFYDSENHNLLLQFNDDKFSVLWKLFFFLIGCFMAAGAAWNIIGGRRTAYAVTNQRLLIIHDYFRRRIVSVRPSEINGIERQEGFGGSGSVTFRQDAVYDGDGQSISKLSFIGIPDVRRVESEIERLKAENGL